MSISERMTGVPWHTEKFVRQEGDDRRHRARCIYLRKSDQHCSRVVGKCVGAAHCGYYKETREESPPGGVAVSPFDNEGTFKGIKEIPLELIDIPERKYCVPAEEKIDALIKYYKEHGKLDKAISVVCSGQRYMLTDKYLRFYVAKLLELKTVPAQIGTRKKRTIEERLRTEGTRIFHSKFGRGTIKEVIASGSSDIVIVLFDSGKEAKLSIEFCIESNYISLDESNNM